MRNFCIENFHVSSGKKNNGKTINRTEIRDGMILGYHRFPDGSETLICSSAPDNLIKALDEGQYDDDMTSGMRLIAALWEGNNTGHYTLPEEQNLILWRWGVAAVFIGQMESDNGLIEIKDDDGNSRQAAVYVGQGDGIVVFPWSERFALANHVEGLAYEQFPSARAPVMAMLIYQSMVEISPGTGALQLSEQGRHGMALLHDDFLEMLKAEGLPDAPTAH